MTTRHRETSMITSIVKADGAGLYVERRGDGPPLLMIAGGGGDGGALATLAGILAASYTVITYDRRGNSRSPLYHDPVKITIAGQSADAVAVLRASAFAAGSDTIALAERADLRHDPIHRPAPRAARRRRVPRRPIRVRVPPGGHLAPMELPAPFAAGLRDVFGRL